jgi:DNA-binding transcriptional MocR family regulator
MLNEARQKYKSLKALGLSLNMSRGNPGIDQLELSQGLFGCLSPVDHQSAAGLDCRNYGGLDGIPEMREIFAELLGVSANEVIIGGNSSLSMMFGVMSDLFIRGADGSKPWSMQGKTKFICPSPGYDRHFAMCKHFGMEMEVVDMTSVGPDMDAVAKLAQDPQIKGMWCVPVFSNPTGCVYSNETVSAIASLKPKAPDFRLFWDNAYFIHQFGPRRPEFPCITKECARHGNPDMPYMFASFSKVTFPGSSIAAVASSKANLDHMRKRLTIETIGPDKMNQLRHARFFKDAQGVLEHMRKIADIIRPKFEAVLDILEKNLGSKGMGEWSKPEGGYFISFNAPPGCARRIVALCREAGLTLTSAGATYPNGYDPQDSNIRLAPSFPSVKELTLAMEVFCSACELACLEKEHSMLG